MKGLFQGTCTLLCSPSALTSGCLPTGLTSINPHSHSFFSNLGLLVPASNEFSLFTVQYFTHTLTQRVSCLCLSFFIRQLSRHLVGLWTAENPVAMNLLKRILVRLQIPTLTQRFDTHPMCMAENSSVMMAIQEKCSWM